jgi:hypothetical protein
VVQMGAGWRLPELRRTSQFAGPDKSGSNGSDSERGPEGRSRHPLQRTEDKGGRFVTLRRRGFALGFGRLHRSSFREELRYAPDKRHQILGPRLVSKLPS